MKQAVKISLVVIVFASVAHADTMIWDPAKNKSFTGSGNASNNYYYVDGSSPDAWMDSDDTNWSFGHEYRNCQNGYTVTFNGQNRLNGNVLLTQTGTAATTVSFKEGSNFDDFTSGTIALTIGEGITLNSSIRWTSHDQNDVRRFTKSGPGTLNQAANFTRIDYGFPGILYELVVDEGTFIQSSGRLNVTNTITVNAGGTLLLHSTGEKNGALTNQDADIIVNGGTIDSFGSADKWLGPYTGTLTINSGTVNLGYQYNNNVAGTTPLVMSGGATMTGMRLSLANGAQTVQYTTTNSGQALIDETATLTLAADSGTTKTFNIADDAATDVEMRIAGEFITYKKRIDIVKTGAGTLELSPHTYTENSNLRNLTLSEGRVIIGNDVLAAAIDATTIASGAVLSVASGTMGTVTNNAGGTVVLAGGTIVSLTNNGTVQVAGDYNASELDFVSGTVEVTGGTVTYDNAPSWGVTAEGGTLVVPDGQSIEVTLGDGGGTFKGAGTFVLPGASTFDETVTFAPGNSIGAYTLEAPGGVVNGATYDCEFSTIAADLATFTESLTISNLTVDLYTMLDDGETPGALEGFNDAAGHVWTILSLSSGTLTVDPGAITVTTENVVGTYDGTFAVGQDGETLKLTFTPIPEPATMLLLAAGGCLAAWRRRRT